MGIWQIIYVGILMLSLGINMAQHGKTEVKKHNFWYSFVACVIQLGILWAGGFFG